MAATRTALLIVRVWIEDESALPLRVSVRSTTDLARRSPLNVTLSDEEATMDAVRVWFRETMAGS